MGNENTNKEKEKNKVMEFLIQAVIATGLFLAIVFVLVEINFQYKVRLYKETGFFKISNKIVCTKVEGCTYFSK